MLNRYYVLLLSFLSSFAFGMEENPTLDQRFALIASSDLDEGVSIKMPTPKASKYWLTLHQQFELIAVSKQIGGFIHDLAECAGTQQFKPKPSSDFSQTRYEKRNDYNESVAKIHTELDDYRKRKVAVDCMLSPHGAFLITTPQGQGIVKEYVPEKTCKRKSELAQEEVKRSRIGNHENDEQ